LTYTYWRKLTGNSWAFAAPKAEPIFISCKNNPIIKTIIQQTGIFSLEKNCIAKTKTVQLSSSHRISSAIQIQTYSNPSLNITNVLQKLFTNISQTEIYDIIQNNSKIKGKQSLFDPHLIKMELNDIIDQAKTLSKFKNIEIPPGTFNLDDILPDLGLSEILPDFDISKIWPNTSVIIVIFLILGILVALRIACK
jgi:hypothetical protein